MGLFNKLFGKKSGGDNIADETAAINAEVTELPTPTDCEVEETSAQDKVTADAPASETPAPKRKGKAKRKTLPKDFDELIKAGDIAALKAVFDICELNAYGGYGKGTALHFYDVPNELIRWLVEQGADINAEDTYGHTPLCKRSHGDGHTAKLLLELGADIHKSANDGATPLHSAAASYQPETVTLLIEHGADINAVTEYKQRNPLSLALADCRNSDIARMAKVAEILLNAGTVITPEMQESVKRIGKNFEFHREAFNKDYLEETEAGLARLYELFSVEPIPLRRVHDGVSPITVTTTRWQEQHSELWDYLVPSKGHAKTVQGEVIRIVGRISDEVLGNGGANWDADYRKMLKSLPVHFATGNALSDDDLRESNTLAEQLRDGNGDDEPARLTELAVRWALNNPTPIALGKVEYKR